MANGTNRLIGLKAAMPEIHPRRRYDADGLPVMNVRIGSTPGKNMQVGRHPAEIGGNSARKALLANARG
jgi:hypothetical protein